MVSYRVKLIGKKEVAEGTTAFEFERPRGLGQIAGQFVIVKHLKPAGPDLFDTRHDYSLASPPYESNLLITTRMRDSLFKNKLKKMKLIKYTRGHVTVLDRPGLERNSCECYGVTKREFDRLLGAPSGVVR